MASAKRVSDEPAFVLHSYDWSESSLILEVFTRHRGRVALAAKGVKRPTSNFRPVLLPLQPLSLSYSLGGEGNGEIHTLKGAEWVGGHVMPQGDALLSGLYLNELLMRLLARDDPYAALFDIYAGVVRVLAGQHGDAIEPVLRTFELLLLRELGHLPALNEESATLAPLAEGRRYALVAEGGLRPALQGERAVLGAVQWQAIESALQARQAFNATLHVVAQPEAALALKPQLRALLQYHCGSPMLRTRQLMMDLQSL
ncbi:DNA repair protein RecO [Delftia tsuruhatensis]|uniref:DNA repair protein RecO n=1 Tax=Delftia tsuruhatensis TaxID=180282 RepID=UPI00244503AF|nr:DNA repair protein RecO [Delftia tsuruhatensis]MDH0777432.1 DNA repair protein RecO [Delftia tsuruhatensis]MDH1461779.1 DNA repair protein RecO [Delftia tsuruhatensis]MDH1826527.1 DNA repair protein RecO [Delftia tsuruhatensis]WGG12467.1 DNA repair protein RecO [Delftia tsuruhatensis]